LFVLTVTGLCGWGDRIQAFFSRPIRSITVPLLENFSGDAQQEYFTDGMTNVLINELGRMGTEPGALKVISPNLNEAIQADTQASPANCERTECGCGR
jgi:TolB-like protein